MTGERGRTILLLLRHAWQLYRHDVVTGSKARIAGCGAVQAYITAVWAYHMSGGEGERRWGGEGRKEGEERRCKEATVK